MLKLLHPVLVHSEGKHVEKMKTCLYLKSSGWFILKNTMHDDHLWIQRPQILSFPFDSISWFWLSGQWKRSLAQVKIQSQRVRHRLAHVARQTPIHQED